MTSVRWTPEAAADLEAIRDCIARDSEHYALLVVHRLLAAIDRLEHFPLSGRAPPENPREAVGRDPDTEQPIGVGIDFSNVSGIFPGKTHGTHVLDGGMIHDVQCLTTKRTPANLGLGTLPGVRDFTFIDCPGEVP